MLCIAEKINKTHHLLLDPCVLVIIHVCFVCRLYWKSYVNAQKLSCSND